MKNKKRILWRSKLQKNYRNFAEWERYSELYGLAKRLGFTSAQTAWDENPTIQGSTDPADFSVVKPKTPKPNKRILSVTIKREYDEDPDTSWLGKYSVRAESEYSIDRKHSEDCILNDTPQKEKLERIAESIENDRPVCEDHVQFVDENCETCQEEKAYTHAMEQVSELAECDCGGVYLDRNSCEYFNPNWQNYKGLPEEDIRKYCRQDYDRMGSLNDGHWCFIGLVVEVQVSIPSGTSAVKSDVHSSLWGIESDSGKAFFKETEEDLLSEVRTQLKALGFSSRAISTAFKTIERKDQ